MKHKTVNSAIEPVKADPEQISLERVSARCPFCRQINYSIENELEIAEISTCDHYDGHNYQRFEFVLD